MTNDDHEVPEWQSRSIERSLGRSRAEAHERSARFVNTALELVEESGGADFTIQEVVDRMRVSTRTFYQYFAGKDELVLAMFEEVQRHNNRDLISLATTESEPLAQLRTFVVGSLRLLEARGNTGTARLMVEQFFRLQVSHQEQLRGSYRGLVAYIRELIAAGIERGEIQERDPDRAAQLVLQVVTSASQAILVGSPLMDRPPTPDEVWEFCLTGIGVVKFDD